MSKRIEVEMEKSDEGWDGKSWDGVETETRLWIRFWRCHGRRDTDVQWLLISGLAA